jgi:hypothetical protein
LWATDNSPRGATFYFTLPTSDEPRDLVVSGDRPEPAGRLHGNDRSPQSMDDGRPTPRD